jgi:capsular polysaccharide biosynthesis protein
LGLLATRGDQNYYHFLADVLPRLAVMAQCPQIETPVRWYVPAATAFQRELLEIVGIGPEQRIDSTVTTHVVADTLVVPGLASNTVRNPPWVTAYLRDLLLPEPIDRIPGRRLYVTRGQQANNRRITNEAAVRVALTDRGFTTIDPGQLTVREQVRAFAEASIIVAPHGAALANLAFASPGAAVIELFPAGFARPDYWKLANGVPGLSYHYLLGAGESRDRGLAGFLVSDIEVDLPALCQMLDALSSRNLG